MNYLIVFIITLASFPYLAQQRLSGHVKSQSSGELLPGAVVYFPDLKSGALTKGDGSFEINNLPKLKTLVQVKLIGYKSHVELLDLTSIANLEVALEESVIEENEIVVTGISKATEIKRNPVPMALIDSKYLQDNSATNIIDALTKVPGIHALSTGPNVSKPYIRGLGSNRILTLFDGVRQEGQQWGDEHGIEVDQYLIDRIEVVKGPASLIYGSDALAGVVNLLPQDPLPESTIKSMVQSNYQSNNGLRSISGVTAGNKKGFIWGLRASYKEAMDFKNKYDGRVYNTGFKERDVNANLGLNRKWGYSHLNFSLYDNLQEIPDGSRDSISRKFTKQLTEADSIRSIVSPSELNAYSIGAIHQRVQHYRCFSTSNFILGKSKLALRLGYQNSVRREYSHPEKTDMAGLYLTLNTLSYDAKYYFPEKNGWEGTTGLNGMYQQNATNKATAFVIPNYQLFDLAPFVFVKKNWKALDLAFGARYDTRWFQNEVLFVGKNKVTGFDEVQSSSVTGVTERFSAYKQCFNGFSGSVGASYRLTKQWLLKANIARGFRAPNVSELAAQGVHPGTGYEQLGNVNFKPEFSLQEDLGIFFDNDHISASAEIFENLISNYIFNQQLGSLGGGDSVYVESGNNYPVFKYEQTKALLYGAEGSIDIHPHPLDWLHFENSISLVYAQNLGGQSVAINATNKYLPFIPPVHSNSELRAEFRKKKACFTAVFIKVAYQYYAAQNRIYAVDGTETKTPSYGLVDAGFGTTIVNKKSKPLVTFLVFANNLTDAAYQSNMSRLKYFDNYPINGTGRSGIYSMGRNISVKLSIPISKS